MTSKLIINLQSRLVLMTDLHILEIGMVYELFSFATYL